MQSDEYRGQFHLFIGSNNKIIIMDPHQSQDSDNQGFVAGQIKIKHQPIAQSIPLQRDPTLFKPHYIVGGQPLRKQIPQALNRVNIVPRQPGTFTKQVNTPPPQHTLPTAKQLFLNQKQYWLTYCRFDQPFGEGARSTFEHQIKLSCWQNYRQQNFRALRQWGDPSQNVQKLQNRLIFDSHFESGNLLCAFKHRKQQNTYTLFMQNDTNTYGYNQWFYFSVQNAKKNTVYTFRIANYRKKYSFFSKGQQPTIFSLRRSQQHGNGWYRAGTDVSYSPSTFAQEGCSPYYTVQFKLIFDYDDDYITLSPIIPYSYTKLLKTLQNCHQIANKNSLNWNLKSISHSLANNQVPYLTLSKGQNNNYKPNIIFLARQHAGQIWSSYLMQQILMHLVKQQSNSSKWIMDNFVVRIFPMINVDGVIYGNFRCDLAGYDLNRSWNEPLMQIQPHIFNIKKQILRIASASRIQLCLDLHTHSRDIGAFAYCCVDSIQGKQLPKIFSKKSKIFRFPACTFGISQDKKYTARAALFQKSSTVNTITVQLSAFGFMSEDCRYYHAFSPKIIRQLAFAFLSGYYCYCNKRSSNQNQQLQQQEEQQKQDQQYELVQIQQESQNLVGSCKGEINKVQESDSEPEADDIPVNIKIQKLFPKKFIDQVVQRGKKKIKNRKVSKKIRKVNKSQQRLVTKKGQPMVQLVAPQIDLKVNKKQAKQQFISVDSANLTQDITQLDKRKTIRPYSIKQQLYNKNSRGITQKQRKKQQRQTKKVNLIEFSLKKLPLFPNEKPHTRQSSLNNVNQNPLPIVGTFVYARRESIRFDKTFSTYEAMVRPRVRNSNRRFAFFKQKPQGQQELPSLCITSQTKRQRLKERSFQFQEEQKVHEEVPNNSTQYQKVQHAALQKFKQKQKGPMEVLSKIGMEQFARYQRGRKNRSKA